MFSEIKTTLKAKFSKECEVIYLGAKNDEGDITHLFGALIYLDNETAFNEVESVKQPFDSANYLYIFHEATRHQDSDQANGFYHLVFMVKRNCI